MALDTQAVDRDVHVVYTVDAGDNEVPASWIRLSRYILQSDVEELLYGISPCCFISFSADEPQAVANEDTLKATIRPHCRMFLSTEIFYSPRSLAKLDKDPKGPGIIGALLRSAFDFSQKIDPEEKAEATVYWAAMLPLDRIARATDPPDHLQPDIAPDWVEAHRQRGARVCILPCDVTHSDALQKVYEEIRATLPPVQGFTDVMRPKVNGGINLDRLFYDTDLDFLVFVSSVNCVVGNVGQANYAAANTFLCGLAAQRRKRGLRTAAVNIGAIIGAGYLERESRKELDALVQRSNSPTAIGRGLASIDLRSHQCCQTGFALYSNPRFSSFIITETALKQEAGGETVVTVGELLRQCQLKEDLQQVVQNLTGTLGEVRVDGRGKLDWDSESHPPADMPNVISIQYARYPPRIVLLTECTGLLGRYLLTHLLLEPGVEKVICLAVRSLARRREQGRLPLDPRVVFYERDLTQLFLGLSKEEVALVFNEADVVIYNGSDTSHLKHYADLRPANVKSTALLARLFIRRRITLHYVSSAGVGIFHEKSGTQGFPPGPVKLGSD
ncbi:putative Polyketide synthase-nonribosomal peptide synthetase [Seiridium unicorne]|uniref:Polyketide synthase-nonribosomal peptide synthetase n=1 Tax=Seiridium unicorne TaxID=138068 RepID=A0ABR2UVS2_9PEZI